MGKSSIVEVAEGNHEAELSTSFYESIDLTKDDVVGVDFLRGKGITKLEDKHRAFALVALPSWHKKF